MALAGAQFQGDVVQPAWRWPSAGEDQAPPAVHRHLRYRAVAQSVRGALLKARRPAGSLLSRIACTLWGCSDCGRPADGACPHGSLRFLEHTFLGKPQWQLSSPVSWGVCALLGKTSAHLRPWLGYSSVHHAGPSSAGFSEDVMACRFSLQ